MKITGTTTTPTSRRTALASQWEDVRSIEEIPDLVAAGRIEPNANVKITLQMRSAPERVEGSDGMRPVMVEAMEQQANGQIRFDGKKSNDSWLYGDVWVIELPARRVERIWSVIRDFTDGASFEAEIGPPVQDYSEPPQEPEPENAALAGPTPLLMLGGAGALAWLLWKKISLS